MIELKPEPYNKFTCPSCYSPFPAVNEVIFQGIHVLADCNCVQCKESFYQVLPVGHTAGYTLAIDRSTGQFYNEPDELRWLTRPLEASLKSVCTDKIKIEKRVFRQCRKVIVLNTLDYLYGHVLLKLYNAQYHLNMQDAGLVLIIPRSMEWMVPEGCAEVWLVDIQLKELNAWYTHLHHFVLREFRRFEAIYLSNAYSHPDFAGVDIRRFTGVKPFDIADYTEKPACITFVTREDRWWYEGVHGYGIYRIGRKLKALDKVGRYLAARQDQLIRRTARRILKALPGATIYITGIGRKGKVVREVVDLRTTGVDAETERDWCRIYARSHVVIGVHGSNMLLPTAFAAGCIEILPKDRYGNMVQDLSVRYPDRRQLFLYRFCEQYASPATIADKAVSMITDFKIFNRNMTVNRYH